MSEKITTKNDKIHCDTFGIKVPFKIPCIGPTLTMASLFQCANNTALRFSAPIYLVGSALRVKEPLDIDLVMVVSDKEFEILIGSKKELDEAFMNNKFNRAWGRWFRFYEKQSRYFQTHVRMFPKIDFDFKVQRKDQFDMYKKQAKRRLDFFGDLARNFK